jgi:type I restriction enzyme M protein
VERTKQLLKDGGVAGVILPNSILSNDGIYAKAREIILQYFKIIAITELGSNTFMATGTNTVVLFLRRRNNYDSINLRKSVERFFDDYQDVTRNGIEKPVAEYVNHVWENITVDDYITLLKKEPNSIIANHEIYKGYSKKIKAKTEKDFWNTLIETEKEKLYYFILACPQRVVLVKTGEKDVEKRFLGYEFSNRRGSEGIHPIQRGKTIDECTRLFDDKRFDNPEKASTYIYRAFSGDYDSPVHESLKDNISHVRLVDMLTFDRESFTKNISAAVKKKVTIESKWDLVRLGDLLFENGKSDIKVGAAKDLDDGDYPFFTSGESILKFNKYLVDNQNIYLSTGGNAIVKFYDGKAAYSTDTFVITSSNEDKIKTKFIFYFLESIVSIINDFYFKGVGLKHLQKPDFRNIQIPFPSLSVQQQIVSEIEVLERNEKETKREIERLSNVIYNILDSQQYNTVELGSIVSLKNGLNYNRKSLGDVINIIGVGDFQNNIVPNLDLIEQIQIEGKLSEDYILQPNDLLVVRSNGSANLVGRFLLIDRILPNTSFSGFTIRLRPNFEKVNSKYLCYYLRTKKIREELTKNSGGSNIKSLNQILLSSLQIPLPPLSEQQKTVSEIEKIEAKMSEAQKIIDDMPTLKNEVLKKYL